jgi:hypothetical protein
MPWFSKGEGSSTPATKAVVKAFSGLVIASEDPTFTYLSDSGIGEALIPANNQSDPNRYPSSARVINTLWGCAPLGTSAASTTRFTLYKNGIATAMTCVIPAASAPGTKASDTAHSVAIADGEDFDVRVDVGIIPDNLPVSATLEGPL